jgi:Flp pilus assembly protein TadB
MSSKEICNRTDRSDPRNHDGFSPDGPSAKASTAGRIFSGKAVEAAAALGVLALCASVFYRVRELLAALILFSAVFGVVMIAVLILWLVEQTAHEGAVRLGAHMAHLPARHIFAPAREHAAHIHRNQPWN